MISNRNLRFFSNPNFFIFPHCLLSYFNLAKTLVSPASFGNPISTSCFLNPNLYSLNSITGSFSCSETNPPIHSLFLCKYNVHRSLSSYFSPFFFSMTYPNLHALQFLFISRYNCKSNGYATQSLNLYFLKSLGHCCFRRFSLSSSDTSRYKTRTAVAGPKASPKQVSQVLNLLQTDKDDWESKLQVLNVRLSVASAISVFKVLNSKKKSALQFFYWIRIWQPELGRNSDICSLVIDNCGRLGDYYTIRCLLNDFKLNNLSLTKMAFEFLPVMAENDELLRKLTLEVIAMLHEIKGTCYGTGIYSLVELFSALGYFDMAKFIIDKTEKKLSYYGVLIREMCQRCDFEGAGDIMDDMRKVDCHPNAQIYNYLISSLLRNGKKDDARKLFQEMKEKDCPVDALTFEIFIYSYCKEGKIDTAFELCNEMVAMGLRPRLLTHAAFIKGFFNLKQYGEAYNYVVTSDDKFSSNVNYTLLASLHQKSGNLVAAENILSEMIKKGLRPNVKVYLEVVKELRMSGKEKLAVDLQQKFFQLELGD